MLKETARSLRLYFFIVAGLSFLAGAGGLTQGAVGSVVHILAVLNLVFGALFAYIAINFEKLLLSKPAFIKKVLLANYALSLAIFAFLYLAVGLQLPALFRLMFASFIYFYLTKSVTRLSQETLGSPPPTQVEPSN